MDSISPDRRSANMSRIRSKHTVPELLVRRALHAAGLRYRLYRDDLPGRPDLVFPSRRLCLFVHGCFWHSCPHCRHGAREVRSNTEYWFAKRARNKARDIRDRIALEAAGWMVLTIWECEVAHPTALANLAAAIQSVSPKA
jgi:DNA mismatch endonuclease, patch repair protein